MNLPNKRSFQAYFLSLGLLTAVIVQTACNRSAKQEIAPAQAATPVVVVEAPTPTATAPAPTVTPTPAEQLQSPLSQAPTSSLAAPNQTIDMYGVEVVDVLPHDRDAFTQGFVFADQLFYEGTGLRGRSSVRRVNPVTGEVLKQIDLAPELFGEGISIFGDRLYQLTWKAQQGFVYDKNTFELLDTFTYPSEGWGLTHDGQNLIMSDGSATLTFRDPETFEELRSVEVHDRNGPIFRLNELEYIEGQVYANIWQTDLIAVIDPAIGSVTAWIDLAGLLQPQDYADQPVDVLNGIAYDDKGDRLFVTGKLWPKIFQIELVPLR